MNPSDQKPIDYERLASLAVQHGDVEGGWYLRGYSDGLERGRIDNAGIYQSDYNRGYHDALHGIPADLVGEEVPRLN